MGQKAPWKPTALVVEDDDLQREFVAVLLEESDMCVIQCESAEVALRVLDDVGASLSMLFTDVSLPGSLDGVELAYAARRQKPDMRVIVTSGFPLTRRLPEGTKFMPKPWAPLDLLREVERSRH